ncbi:MAG TPA: universal stress protein [Noviherbaspirillum sp.]|nr:universal stress protein [Noviherbaspirillum sp.]
MSYKTILVHVDKDQHAAERIALASRIANAQNAHLVGVAPTGVSRLVYQTRYVYDGGRMASNLDEHLDRLRAEAASALNAFEAEVDKIGARSFESRPVDDEAGAAISLQARYADLVVLGQYDPEHASAVTMSDFPEFVVMNSGRPVLLVPYTGHFPEAGKRVMIAWDASTSATRAVTAAIPLLKQAAQVDVVVFNGESSDEGHGEQPGADIALYLARHGVQVNVVRQKTSGIDVGNALLSMASDLGSDMMVMGGYGHSRFREILLGGVTRTVLQSMTVPVLMAH